MCFSLCAHMCVCSCMHAHTCACSCALCMQVTRETKGGLQIPQSWSCKQLHELPNLYARNQTCVLWKSSVHSQSLRRLSSRESQLLLSLADSTRPIKPSDGAGSVDPTPDVPIFISHRYVSVKAIKVIL